MPRIFLLLLLTASASGCDFLGSKDDRTTDEIFQEGRIEPGLVDEVAYVALPTYVTGGDGAPLDAPTDVFVGYDELIYVTDARGLHVLDRAGRPLGFEPLAQATNVMQDRRLHVYVTSVRDTTVADTAYTLPAVYRFSGLTTGAAQVEDVIVFPFDDPVRSLSNQRTPVRSDEQVRFTGLAVQPDNSIYVSRRGPDVRSPRLNASTLTYDAVVLYDRTGRPIRTEGLSATQPSLRSAINPADVISPVAPPQQLSFPASAAGRLYLAQQGETRSLRFSVLAFDITETLDGIDISPIPGLLGVVGDTTRGRGFLFEEGRFAAPSDLAITTDGTNYLFVVDSALDSLYAFTLSGIEGVQPPAGAQDNRPVNVSFGGSGGGGRQFRNPQGVAYFRQTVFVADTGNNRISRFRLTTDFE